MGGFNVEQWAQDHEKRDDERFGAIFKVIGVAGLSILGMLGWSIQTQVRNAEAQIAAIEQVQAELAKPSN